MRAFGWQGNRSVADWLVAEPYRFDFFQAVRILELIRGGVSPGSGSEVAKESVRFRSRVGLDFPASEIQQITVPSTASGQAEMTVNFLGLAGAFGPMAPPDTESLLERIRAKDYAMRDFLDIFNHRLLSLMYQVRKVHRVALTTASPEQTPMARYLYSLFGLGLAELRDRLEGVDDRALLYSAGILSHHPRSAAGLGCLLARHFGVSVQVVQLMGKWRDLAPDQWTRIGAGGQHRRLGDSAAAGTRVWDQQGTFEVRMGPLSFAQFNDFLEGGSAYAPLCAMTRFYTGPEFDFTFRLVLQAADVPPLRLGVGRLGRTSWLTKVPSAADDSQVRIRPA